MVSIQLRTGINCAQRPWLYGVHQGSHVIFAISRSIGALSTRSLLITYLTAGSTLTGHLIQAIWYARITAATLAKRHGLSIQASQRSVWMACLTHGDSLAACAQPLQRVGAGWVGGGYPREGGSAGSRPMAPDRALCVSFIASPEFLL